MYGGTSLAMVTHWANSRWFKAVLVHKFLNQVANVDILILMFVSLLQLLFPAWPPNTGGGGGVHSCECIEQVSAHNLYGGDPPGWGLGLQL
jgi:hypothetical protein